MAKSNLNVEVMNMMLRSFSDQVAMVTIVTMPTSGGADGDIEYGVATTVTRSQLRWRWRWWSLGAVAVETERRRGEEDREEREEETRKREERELGGESLSFDLGLLPKGIWDCCSEEPLLVLWRGAVAWRRSVVLRSWRKTMLFGRIGGMLVDVAECCVMYLYLDLRLHHDNSYCCLRR